MKIIWKHNPLDSYIEFEEGEDNIIENLISYDRLWTAAQYHRDPIRFRIDPQEAQEKFYKALDTDISKEEIEEFKAALKSGHFGDCTSFPCSCYQCWAESVVGISTIKGLGNSMGHQIFSAAEGTYDSDNQIDAIIENLKNYNPTINEKWEGKEDMWNEWLPKWKAQAASAAKWMEEYKAKHFEKDNEP